MSSSMPPGNIKNRRFTDVFRDYRNGTLVENRLINNRFFQYLQKQSLGVSCKKGVLKNLVKLTGKHLWWSLIFNCINFIKKRLVNKCFPVNIAKFLKIIFYRTPPVSAFKNCSSKNLWNIPRKNSVNKSYKRTSGFFLEI